MDQKSTAEERIKIYQQYAQLRRAIHALLLNFGVIIFCIAIFVCWLVHDPVLVFS